MSGGNATYWCEKKRQCTMVGMHSAGLGLQIIKYRQNKNNITIMKSCSLLPALLIMWILARKLQ